MVMDGFKVVSRKTEKVRMAGPKNQNRQEYSQLFQTDNGGKQAGI